MKKPSLLLFILLFFFCYCNKSSEDNAVVESTCYSGKFVATGCHGTAIIQIVSPRDKELESSVFKADDQSIEYNYVVSTIIPERFRDGNPFHFTIDTLSAIGVTTQECLWPKYSAVFGNMSVGDCDSSVHQ
jgi:hypothetical protein